MSNTEAVNFRISMPNDNRKPCKLTYLTLEQLWKWIDAHQLDSKLKELLKKSAATFPQKALEHWQKNFIHHLGEAQKQLRASTPIITNAILENKDQVENKVVDFSMPSENDFD